MKLLQWRLRPLSGALTLNLAKTLRTIQRNCSSRYFCSGHSSSFALKHVTRSNFESALADLRRHIRAADFVAVDLEMTGVTSAPWREIFGFDRRDICYLKIKDSAEKFAVVQFGVCPFHWDHSKQCFIANPYNFYIFPRQEFPLDGPSHEFLCQTSSIDFLAKYQFDFNTCINEGVSYLSRRQEDEALRCLTVAYEDELSHSFSGPNEVKEIPSDRMADVFFAERMKNRFSEWRDGLLQPGKLADLQGSSNSSAGRLQTTFYKMRPSLVLNGFTSHQMKLVQWVSRMHFEDLVYVRIDGEDSSLQHLLVYTDSKEDRSILMKEVKDELHNITVKKVNGAVGFRKVIDLLSSEKKLIVGHNSFLDFAHMYSKFVGPLPSSAEEYLTMIHNRFPCIVDTKVILNANNILKRLVKKKSTSLSKAFALLCPQLASGSETPSLGSQPCAKVEVQVDDMSSCKWNSGAKHEAGYDAFMTGSIFAQACLHLGIDFNLHSPSLNLAQNEMLEKHVNLLYLSWSNGQIIDLRTNNWNGESSGSNNPKKYRPKILFSNIVLIWGFPSKLKASDIRECISKAFGVGSVVFISHLDDTAVLVQFNKAELVTVFLGLKETLEKSNDLISVFHPLSGLLEGGNTCAAGYEVYKEICSSPISEVLFADQAKAVHINWKTNFIEVENEAEAYEPDNSSIAGPVASDSEENKGSRTGEVMSDISQVICRVMGS